MAPSLYPHPRCLEITFVIYVVYLDPLARGGPPIRGKFSAPSHIEGIHPASSEAFDPYRFSDWPDVNTDDLSIYGIATNFPHGPSLLLYHSDAGVLEKADEEEQGHYYCYYDEDLFLLFTGETQAFRLPASGAFLCCSPSTWPSSTCPSGTCLSGTCPFRTCLSGTRFSCACSLGTRHNCLLREFSLFYIKGICGCQTIYDALSHWP
jgi:hypothetical protein